MSLALAVIARAAESLLMLQTDVVCIHAGQSRDVDRDRPARPMPAAALPILTRIQSVVPGFVPDQLTVNDYEPGVGLSPHIDTHSAFAGRYAAHSHPAWSIRRIAFQATASGCGMMY